MNIRRRYETEIMGDGGKRIIMTRLTTFWFFVFGLNPKSIRPSRGVGKRTEKVQGNLTTVTKKNHKI